MTASWVLVGLGVALLTLGPRLRGMAWMDNSPRLGIAMWQALCLSAVTVPVLIGLTLLIPATAWVAGLAALMHACALSLQQAYGFHGDALEPTLGLLLVGTVVAWTATRLAYDAWSTHRERDRMRNSLAKVSAAHPTLGVHVVDSPAAAAFCIPGRSSRVLVTAGAMAALSPEELGGVLAHERAHLRAHHHLAVFVAGSLSRAFPGVSLFATAASQTARLVELAADDSAARTVPRVVVASAIVRLASMRAPSPALAMADCSTPGVTVTRVGRMLSPEHPLQSRRLGLAVSALILVLSTPVAVAMAPAAAAAITHLCTGVS
ncbi:Zn-dependent protease with chaperone function [Klenkia marina]|uniref:Zn-dependent protease with chaperone function n=1 Tax=Klenkia marina TaxID=1960309 RepID=A0A1G4Z3K1_9ACTN|nr:M56 family metallopeptidase [Klenkia marina]SCX60250.1 Zn-dependent protease with chaperone function [Klenkia marina]